MAPVGYLREDGELSGEDVIPGFRCMVREILPSASFPGSRSEPEWAPVTAGSGESMYLDR